jgi:hypothetical protein
MRMLPRMIDDLQRPHVARPPMPDRTALAAMPPSLRLRLLIERLDEIRMVVGHYAFSDNTFVPAFQTIGPDAIDALLPVIESDPRLTNTLTSGRGWGHFLVHGVEDAAYSAVSAILHRSFYVSGGRTAQAAAIRAYWNTWRNVTLEEKWYRQLADDHADHHDQVMAALELAQPSPNAAHKLRGDPLRGHAPPSVSALLEKRIDATTDMHDACNLADAFHRWDPGPAGPVITRLHARVIADAGTTDKNGSCINNLANMRLASGDPTGIDDYAQWVAGIVPDGNGVSFLVYAGLAPKPRRPSVTRALDAMFRDGSIWLPLDDPTGVHADLSELLTEELLDHPGVNRHALAALADHRSFATLEMPEALRYRVSPHHHGGGVESIIDPSAPHVPPQGTKQTVRVADWIAYRLAHHRTNISFQLYWSEPRRDAAIAALAGWVRAQRRP